LIRQVLSEASAAFVLNKYVCMTQLHYI
jgi:hypothetical protein